MAIKFEFPIKLPRFTSDEFEEMRDKYVAKHGYEIYIPEFRDVFTWNVAPSPSPAELALYKKKDISKLGEKRYSQIKSIMERKREQFLRMLSSPSSRTMRSAASILTFLDDTQDTLGTFGAVARIVAHKLPRSLGKIVGGPAGWFLMASDVVNIAVRLSRLHFKGRRLQHELHHMLRDNAFTKRGRVKIAKKLRQIRLNKGEIIEALQTTDNVFGAGLCLGGIAALVYDIPAGLYHHIRGKKVTIRNLPRELVWFDQIWSRTLKTTASLWTGIPELDDHELGQSMVAFNQATIMAKNVLQDLKPIEMIREINSIEIPVPRPTHPSTAMVIHDEVGNSQEHSNWPINGKPWCMVSDFWNEGRTDIIDNLKQWWQRNRHDTESMVCSQNAVQAGMNMLALHEGDDAVETAYDSVSDALFKLFNLNYRFPPGITDEQAKCWTDMISSWDAMDEPLDIQHIRNIAYLHCDFIFTTEVPERPGLTEEEKAEKRKHNIDRLKKWYFSGAWTMAINICFRSHIIGPRSVENLKKILPDKLEWLDYYGYPTELVEKMLSILPSENHPCVRSLLKLD